MNNLPHKTAIVTGASRGIGAAIALQLAQSGHKVVVNYSNDLVSAEQVVQTIKSKNGEAIAVKADVSDSKQINALFEQTERHFGKPDVVVSNAAMQVHKMFNQHSQADIDHVFDLNAKGVFSLLQQATQRLNDNGHIVAVSTSLTSMMVPGYAAYTGAKAAVEQFVRSLAKEVAKRGININAVAPGPVDTDLLRNTESPEGLNFLAGLSGFSRLGTPEDIAKIVRFLSSDDSRWISGQVIRANGALI
jgi:3-oxoacyl-[acyl-carrier protein] reductase